MRPRVILAAALASIVLGGLLLVPAAFAKLRDEPGSAQSGVGTPTPTPKPSPTPPPPPPPPTLAPQPVSAKVNGFLSWALMDLDSGRINGSRNIAATNTTESMIKIWLVADYLRRTAEKKRKPTAERLKQASVAIRDSSDSAAQSLYAAGGRNAVVGRMIKICKLTDTKIYSGWWSRTRISARDAVRLGACVADGRAAGPQWTKWVLAEMRNVRGTAAKKDQRLTSGGGRWGIVDGLPPEILEQGVAIKNGWTAIGSDNSWHVNCLAVHRDWALAVLMRYPARQGLLYGAGVCKQVTQQLVFQPPPPGGAS
ncbi:MAG TPA: hypothetical protein VFT95_14620 [Micromonosporaceae bacterium]|nr:hypothetical protein [Micromonosporaceae bacterium]